MTWRLATWDDFAEIGHVRPEFNDQDLVALNLRWGRSWVWREDTSTPITMAAGIVQLPDDAPYGWCFVNPGTGYARRAAIMYRWIKRVLNRHHCTLYARVCTDDPGAISFIRRLGLLILGPDPHHPEFQIALWRGQ